MSFLQFVSPVTRQRRRTRRRRRLLARDNEKVDNSNNKIVNLGLFPFLGRIHWSFLVLPEFHLYVKKQTNKNEDDLLEACHAHVGVAVRRALVINVHCLNEEYKKTRLVGR